MTKTVTLIDYGIGNLLSVERALRHVGADFRVARTADDIAAADKLVLPGVGAFTSCTGELHKRGLTAAVRESVAASKPMLGICVGMQMLFDASEEFGTHAGLGLISGNVRAIPPVDHDGHPHKIPHIGWTSLTLPPTRNDWSGTLLDGIPDAAEVYYVHSFTAHPANESDRLADSTYGGQRLSAVVQRGNLGGVQFHPEKSGPVGLKILENFTKF